MPDPKAYLNPHLNQTLSPKLLIFVFVKPAVQNPELFVYNQRWQKSSNIHDFPHLAWFLLASRSYASSLVPFATQTNSHLEWEQRQKMLLNRKNFLYTSREVLPFKKAHIVGAWCSLCGAFKCSRDAGDMRWRRTYDAASSLMSVWCVWAVSCPMRVFILCWKYR